MALGTYNNNKDEKKNYSPTVYSPYSFSNSESEVDPSKLSVSFWNKFLVLSIAPLKKTQDGSIAYDYDNQISVHLSYTKARLLAIEIAEFMKDPVGYSNVGVPSGAGLISLSNGKELGVNCSCIIIRKINGESGIVESAYAYQFKQKYHYSIRNFDEKTGDLDKIYNDNLEIEEMLTLLTSYYEAMTGALAYSVIDNMKYDNSRINTKINSICEKLGVDIGGKGNYNNKKSSTSYFNSKESRDTNFSNSTLDDIEDLMND